MPRQEPKPLPLPDDPDPVVFGAVVDVPKGLTTPYYAVFTVPSAIFGMGYRIKVTVDGAQKTNFAVYGPNPARLAGETGRMGLPGLGGTEGRSYSGESNLKPGTYYVCVRSNVDNPPLDEFTYRIDKNRWKVFMPLPDDA